MKREIRSVTEESLAQLQSTELDPDVERGDLATQLAEQVESVAGPGQLVAWQDYAEEQLRLRDEVNRQSAELVRKRQQERRELEAETMRKLAAGEKIPPVRIARMPSNSDLTVPQDVSGKNFTPPGERVGWFRMFTANGTPTTARVAEMTAAGFKFVKDADGRVITRMNHVCMSAPPETWAEYKADRNAGITQSVEMKIDEFRERGELVSRGGRRIGASWVPNDQEFADLNRAVTPR